MIIIIHDIIYYFILNSSEPKEDHKRCPETDRHVHIVSFYPAP